MFNSVGRLRLHTHLVRACSIILFRREMPWFRAKTMKIEEGYCIVPRRNLNGLQPKLWHRSRIRNYWTGSRWYQIRMGSFRNTREIPVSYEHVIFLSFCSIRHSNVTVSACTRAEIFRILDLFPNNLSTAISIFRLRLRRNYSTYMVSSCGLRIRFVISASSRSKSGNFVTKVIREQVYSHLEEERSA